MLAIHYSNRLESLADRLAEALRAPWREPLAAEAVVVQSRAVARWLRERLAERLGVCANVRFPYPAAYVWELFRSVLPEIPPASPFDPAVLAWRIQAALDKLEDAPRFAPLLRYLNGADARDRYRLALGLADAFQGYLVQRPDWIARWQQGRESDAPHEAWQAELWRRIARTETGGFREDPTEQFFAALGNAQGGALPERIHLFGIGALPPRYLEIFRRTAEYLDVRLYVPNPCREYWGDLASPRQAARAGLDRAPNPYLEIGHPLLAALGKAPREFFDLLQELPAAEEEEMFHDPGTGTLLHALQSDILNLRRRGTAETPPLPIAAADVSLQIHVCHGPAREAEVLHDQLLALFQRRPDLTASDVVVLLPDFAAYAPHLEAIFSTALPAIPHRLEGDGRLADTAPARTFLQLLALAESRYGVNRVLGLLETGPVMRRFDCSESDLAWIRRWVEATAIRWGVDAAARQELGLPATSEHTWQAGLHRLLLGYALPGEDRRSFADILPYDEVEGENAAALGRFVTFLKALFKLRRDIRQPRSPAAWSRWFAKVLQDFLAPEEDEEAATAALAEALESLAADAQTARYAAAIPWETACEAARQALARASIAIGSRGRGVSIRPMTPHHCVPARVICLVGMNDGAFPRHPAKPGFDLLPGRPRKGDRSRREEDLALFLDALLMARDHLYISTTGFGPRDAGIIPPAPVVSQLLDQLRESFVAAGGGDAAEAVTTRHPLQAFSPRYFHGDDKLFSFRRDLLAAARQTLLHESMRPLAMARGASATPVLSAVEGEPANLPRALELDTLLDFFAHPVRHVLRQRYGVRLEEGEGLLEDREPFALEKRTQRSIRRELMEKIGSGADADEAYSLLRKRGLLPHGASGSAWFRLERQAAADLGSRLAPWLAEQATAPLEIQLEAGGLHLAGWLSQIGPQGLTRYRIGEPGSRDQLDLWIRHLALNSLAPAGIMPVSRLLWEQGELQLRPVADPLPRLAALIALYRRGWSELLPLFPNASFAFAKASRSRSGKTDPMAAARKAWLGSDQQHWSEGDDPYHRYAFRGTVPLDDPFPQLALEVFEPLLEHLTAQQQWPLKGHQDRPLES